MLNTRKILTSKVRDYINSTSKETSVGIISDYLTMQLNEFTSTFGYSYYSTKDKEKILSKNKELKLNLDENILNSNKTESGISLLSDLYKQKEILAAQLVVAKRQHRFVSLHNRRTWSDFFEVLKELRITKLHGICHHFTGSPEIARKLLDLGLYLSFCGPVTYPDARRIHAAAIFAPSDRILSETDCPDLPPLPCKGQLSCPWHVQYVVETLAELRHTTIPLLAEQIERNWHSLFSNL